MHSVHPQIQQSSSPSSSSLPTVWKGCGEKVGLLLPYVWPKGSSALQGLVLVCVGLLAAERLVNVLVPVYSKNIGKQALKTTKVLQVNMKIWPLLVHMNMLKCVNYTILKNFTFSYYFYAVCKQTNRTNSAALSKPFPELFCLYTRWQCAHIFF